MSSTDNNAAPGAAIAAREQEATPLPKGDLSKVWQAADDVCEWLNYEVWPEKSPGLKKSVDILNEAMGRAEIRASRAASRKEAPATPQGETAGLSEVTERYCNKCGYFGPDQIHYRPNGLGECGYIARIRTQPTTVQQAEKVLMRLREARVCIDHGRQLEALWNIDAVIATLKGMQPGERKEQS